MHIIFFIIWLDPVDAGRGRRGWNPEGAHLAVLMGLGSKLPWESTDVCFSSVPSRLTSTKSGGRAPAMAHRHDLAILKSSASYFCRWEGRGRKMKRRKRGEGGVTIWLFDMKGESGKVPSDEPSRLDEWFICYGLARSPALHQALAPLSVASETSAAATEEDSRCCIAGGLDGILKFDGFKGRVSRLFWFERGRRGGRRRWGIEEEASKLFTVLRTRPLRQSTVC